MFQVEDHYTQCVGTKWQDMVCLDSCCEFFVAPEAVSSAARTPMPLHTIGLAAELLSTIALPGLQDRLALLQL
eukprot:SAG31_NODE_3512_length_4172_cov_30.849251_3_plen_73_part_00